MTVSEAIRQAAERLAETSDTARLDAELLMAHALGTDRSSMLLRSMADPVPQSFAALAERRARHEPVAYITGQADFFGRDFLVAPGVLIPRPDSETVVDAALEVAPETGRVLDLGTGSGALLLTIIAEREGLEGVGVDASFDAVQIAAENAARLGVQARARIVKADWNEAGWADDLGRFDCIIANPPYVANNAELAPDVRDFEPSDALFAGPEGLDDYAILIPQLCELTTPDAVIILEIGHDQAESVSEIAAKSGFSAEIRTDLAGRDRALILRQL
ncbi:peptide chain release factor N(5)-glutamine methyltransferase [Altererythrobacter lutimaris]|uniref:Release factor glutamine methyltransferase n=1 Tax=Altererythrobacter lutimaris TaxID=2743979 RepID=A0A850HBD9_9SPHN|nr:peptide chain release factor N(5)-glutamine methyltransferase [Altererythrobacter lutimaris]NVE95069.1 peptide chain release factor N(5)-glutamine methyltransferase [Altererythrobacter lutimaris]